MSQELKDNEEREIKYNKKPQNTYYFSKTKGKLHMYDIIDDGQNFSYSTIYGRTLLNRLWGTSYEEPDEIQILLNLVHRVRRRGKKKKVGRHLTELYLYPYTLLMSCNLVTPIDADCNKDSHISGITINAMPFYKFESMDYGKCKQMAAKALLTKPKITKHSNGKKYTYVYQQYKFVFARNNRTLMQLEHYKASNCPNCNAIIPQ
eukprot:UN01949